MVFIIIRLTVYVLKIFVFLQVALRKTFVTLHRFRFLNVIINIIIDQSKQNPFIKLYIVMLRILAIFIIFFIFPLNKVRDSENVRFPLDLFCRP